MIERETYNKNFFEIFGVKIFLQTFIKTRFTVPDVIWSTVRFRNQSQIIIFRLLFKTDLVEKYDKAHSPENTKNSKSESNR